MYIKSSLLREMIFRTKSKIGTAQSAMAESI